MDDAGAAPSPTPDGGEVPSAAAPDAMDAEAPVGPPKPDAEEKKKKARVKKHDVPFQVQQVGVSLLCQGSGLGCSVCVENALLDLAGGC